MRLRALHVAALVVVVVLGTVGVTSLTGVWVTESTRVPRVIKAGTYAGSSDPADIRGSYTFGDIERAFAVPASVVAEAFGLTGANPADFAAKDLEEVYGEIDGMEVGTDSLRLFVSLYTGVPYTPEETTALPAAAFRILLAQSGEAVTAHQDRVTELPRSAAVVSGAMDDSAPGGPAATAAADANVSGTGVTHETGLQEGVVKGATTFADVLAWGLSREQVESVIGGPMPARATRIRDHATEQGVSFGTYREAFQQLLDAEQ